MMESDRQYHQRRAAMQRSLADDSADPAAATAHHALADLHEARARAATPRPVLRMVTRA